MIFVWSASWELFAVALPRQTNPAASTSCFSQTCVWRILARRAFVTARSLDTLAGPRKGVAVPSGAVSRRWRMGRLGARARDQRALSQFFGRRSEGLYGRRGRASPTIADAAGSRASANTIFIVSVSCGAL